MRASQESEPGKGRAVRLMLIALAGLMVASFASAQRFITVAPRTLVEWKAVYGQIEARTVIPARARLGGTLVELNVTEGDRVTAGQKLGRIVDEKIVFKLGSVDAQLKALGSQLTNARTDLARGKALLARGVMTRQRLDALQTRVDVLSNRIEAANAQRSVIEEQASEGTVLAPISGLVLKVPVARGSVLMPGEEVANIGGGGFYLRLAVPERYAPSLIKGASIRIDDSDGVKTGKLVKIYPTLEHGRVLADVEVSGLSERFVNARLLVRLPIGKRQAIMVPRGAILTRSGLDFVRVREAGAVVLRTVVIGTRQDVNGSGMVEVLSGLSAGDKLVTGQ